LCTLRSTVLLFLLFFTLDLSYLALGVAYLNASKSTPWPSAVITGSIFGVFSAMFGWYNALAGIADTKNSFFTLPVFPFPWGKEDGENALLTSSRD
jgi:succinate-acetate transporter protein